MAEAPVLTSGGQPIYGRIPRSLLRDPSVSRDARLLFGIIEDHCSKEDDAPWPSQEVLAEYMGASDRAVRNWLNELAKAGYLQVMPRPGRSNRHHLQWIPAQAPRNGGSAPPRNGGSDHPGTAVPTKKNQKEEPVEEAPLPPDGGCNGSTLFGATELAKLSSGRKARKRSAENIPDVTRAQFATWYEHEYPGSKRNNRQTALRAWARAMDAGVSVLEITVQTRHYVAALKLWAQSWPDHPRAPMSASSFIGGRDPLDGKRLRWSEPWDQADCENYWPAPDGYRWSDAQRQAGPSFAEMMAAERAGQVA